MKIQYNSKTLSLLLLSGFLVSQQAYAMDDDQFPNKEGFPKPSFGKSPTSTQEEIAAAEKEQKRQERINRLRDQKRKERAQKVNTDDQLLKDAEEFFTDLTGQGNLPAAKIDELIQRVDQLARTSRESK